MTIDNFAPTATPFPTVLQWRYAGTSGWTNLLTLPCPLITRDHVADVEIQIGRDRIPVRARIAHDEERSRLWSLADDVNKGQYTEYQSRTTREIPVVVLEPR